MLVYLADDSGLTIAFFKSWLDYGDAMLTELRLYRMICFL